MRRRHAEIAAVLFTAVLLAAGVGYGNTTEPEEPQSQPAEAPAEANSGGEEQQPEPAKDRPTANTIRWTTASEVDNFGFDIYRSTSEEGPFDRVTAEPIAGAGTTDEPQSYVYVDDTNDPTIGYYYYVESISMAGVRERFSPVAYVRPKRPASSEQEAEQEKEQ